MTKITAPTLADMKGLFPDLQVQIYSPSDFQPYERQSGFDNDGSSPEREQAVRSRLQADFGWSSLIGSASYRDLLWTRSTGYLLQGDGVAFLRHDPNVSVEDLMSFWLRLDPNYIAQILSKEAFDYLGLMHSVGCVQAGLDYGQLDFRTKRWFGDVYAMHHLAQQAPAYAEYAHQFWAHLRGISDFLNQPETCWIALQLSTHIRKQTLLKNPFSFDDLVYEDSEFSGSEMTNVAGELRIRTLDEMLGDSVLHNMPSLSFRNVIMTGEEGQPAGVSIGLIALVLFRQLIRNNPEAAHNPVGYMQIPLSDGSFVEMNTDESLVNMLAKFNTYFPDTINKRLDDIALIHADYFTLKNPQNKPVLLQAACAVAERHSVDDPLSRATLQQIVDATQVLTPSLATRYAPN